MRLPLLTLAAITVGLTTTSYAQSDCVETIEGDSTIFDAGYTYGGATTGDSMALFVTPNPDAEGNDSETVLAFVEYDDSVAEIPVWQGFQVVFDEPVRFAEGEPQQITMLVWGATVATVPIKLEGADGLNTQDVLARDGLQDSMQWTTLTYDLSDFDFAANDYTIFSVTPNNSAIPDSTQTWYFDDVTFGSGTGVCGVAADDDEEDDDDENAAPGECVEDFEGEDTVIGTDATIQFGQDDLDSVITIVANPDTTGNPSETVLRFNEYAAADPDKPWAGFTTELGRTVVIPDSVDQVITMMVWGSRAGVVNVKPEIRAMGGIDISPVEGYDTPGEWRLLTYDVTDLGLNDSMYTSLGIVPGNDAVPEEDATWYIDNISFGPAACGMAVEDTSVAVRTPLADIARLAAYPNPAGETVTLDLVSGASAVTLFDALGRSVLTERFATPSTDRDVRVLTVGSLPAGSYTAVARAEDGRVLGRARLLIER